jgi:DNA-binding protein YbaB
MENTALFSRFEDVHAQYTRLRAGVDALRRDLEALEVTVRSPDGLVTVVVGPQGNLKNLALQDNEPLAALVVEAMRKAEMLAAEAVRDRLTHILPDGGGLDDVLRRHDEVMGYSDAP